MGSGCCGDWLKKKKQQQQLPGVGENVEIERVADGVDLMDAAMAEANVCPPHLVIMVNGLIGRYFLSSPPPSLFITSFFINRCKRRCRWNSNPSFWYQFSKDYSIELSSTHSVYLFHKLLCSFD